MQLHNNFPGAELEHSPEGEFISLESVKQMVTAGIADRVTKDSVVKPEEVTVSKTYDKASGERWNMGPRHTYSRDGYLMPDRTVFHSVDEAGNEYRNRARKSSTEALIYEQLTDADTVINLASEGIAKLYDDAAKLEDDLGSHSYTFSLSSEQKFPAYHIDGNDAPQEFQPLRLYVPAGMHALGVMRKIVELDTEMHYAKVWVPILQEGQAKFRQDTPILEVINHRQLTSVISNLRMLNDEGLLPAASHVPLVGMLLGNVPGVYLGQIAPGRSFNGTMDGLFGSAVVEACQLNNLQTGEVITDSWLSETATIARGIARRQALQMGIDPANHAFLVGEPKDDILRTISAAL